MVQRVHIQLPSHAIGLNSQTGCAQATVLGRVPKGEGWGTLEVHSSKSGLAVLLQVAAEHCLQGLDATYGLGGPTINDSHALQHSLLSCEAVVHMSGVVSLLAVHGAGKTSESVHLVGGLDVADEGRLLVLRACGPIIHLSGHWLDRAVGHSMTTLATPEALYVAIVPWPTRAAGRPSSLRKKLPGGVSTFGSASLGAAFAAPPSMSAWPGTRRPWPPVLGPRHAPPERCLPQRGPIPAAPGSSCLQRSGLRRTPPACPRCSSGTFWTGLGASLRLRRIGSSVPGPLVGARSHL